MRVKNIVNLFSRGITRKFHFNFRVRSVQSHFGFNRHNTQNIISGKNLLSRYKSVYCRALRNCSDICRNKHMRHPEIFKSGAAFFMYISAYGVCSGGAFYKVLRVCANLHNVRCNAAHGRERFNTVSVASVSDSFFSFQNKSFLIDMYKV